MKFLRYISVAASLIMLSACNDSFLERVPLDQISEGTYWKTNGDIKLYTNQFYTSIWGYRLGEWSTHPWSSEFNSDNMINNAYNRHFNGETLQRVSGDGWNWTNVRNVNYGLANIEKMGELDQIGQHYKGELLYFRAQFYYDLLKRYGDLPWIDKPLNIDSEELQSPRISRHEVVKNMIADLTEAESLMQPASGVPESGRLHRDVATIFKARVALYEGTWEKYHKGTVFGVEGKDGSEMLAVARDAAKKLMDSGQYDIVKGSEESPRMAYRQMFNKKTYIGVKENIFSREFDMGANMYNDVQRFLATRNGMSLSKELVDSYLCTDGQPISTSPLYQGDDSLDCVVANRDPRLAAILNLPGDLIQNMHYGKPIEEYYVRPAILKNAEMATVSGYRACKGADLNVSHPKSDFWGYMTYRYAEVLLIYAEARAELGELTQKDVDMTINKLRDRVSMPHWVLGTVKDPDWDFPTLGEQINEIRRERRVELAQEGQRLDDIFRWAAADELIVGKRPLGAKYHAEYYNKDRYPIKPSQWTKVVKAENPATLAKFVEERVNEQGYIDYYKIWLPNGYDFNVNRDYLYPIPSQELVLNKSLTQNPGWPGRPEE